jgi:peptidoglycan/xylan/chitin deacetylase (PgdA/CDA1 family)
MNHKPLSKKIVNVILSGRISQKVSDFIITDDIKVLMYHRVISKKDIVYSYKSMAVNEVEFEKQIIFLKKNYRIISLDELYDLYRNYGHTKHKNNNVVITFDDGYKDNLTVAYPILKKHNIPAAIFLATNYITESKKSCSKLLWPDHLGYLIANCKSSKMNLPVIGYLNLSDQEQRCKSMISVSKYIKTLSYTERDSFMDSLNVTFNITPPDTLANELYLSWDDINVLGSDNNLITFGSHTSNHIILSRESNLIVEKELLESKNVIEHKTGKKAHYFCFPNGTKEDYNSNSMISLAKAKYRLAFTAVPGINRLKFFPYQIRRSCVPNNYDITDFKTMMCRITKIFIK